MALIMEFVDVSTPSIGSCGSGIKTAVGRYLKTQRACLDMLNF